MKNSKTSVASRMNNPDIANLTDPRNRRQSRISQAEAESIQQAYVEHMQFVDPLGLGANGNLPDIQQALRDTGTVCVERSMRILNKS